MKTLLLLTALSSQLVPAAHAESVDLNCTATAALADGTSFNYDLSLNMEAIALPDRFELLGPATLTVSHIVDGEEIVYLDQGETTFIQTARGINAVVEQSIYGLGLQLIPGNSAEGFGLKIRHKIYDSAKIFSADTVSCAVL